MNLQRVALLTVVLSSGAFGQTYTAKTIAGGGDLFPSNVPATSIGIGGASAMAGDNAGNIYWSNAYSMVVRWNVNTGHLSVVAGNGTTGFSGDGGPATSAQLGDLIYGIAVDSSGSVYIADTSNQRVRKVSNGVITTVAGTGVRGFNGDNGPAADAQVKYPSGVAVDSFGNLYIADIGNQRIRKISNGVITTVAGNGTFGFGGDNGPATDAQLEQPAYVAAGSSGEFYIPDYVSHRIRKVSNGVITTIAGTGTAGFTGDNGPAANAQLNDPGNIVVDSSGNLYFGDGQRIRTISNGVITTVAGNGFSGGPLGDNGPATATAVAGPIAVDPSGNIYIGDGVQRRIRKVTNGVITTVAGNGSDVHQGYSGDNGPALSALLSLPLGVAVDPSGTNIYIADTNNSSIRKVSNGVISTVPFTIAPGCNDGSKSPTVPLSPPRGLAVDMAGNIYIAEYSCVREISQGVLIPFAGTGTSATTGDNGPAIQARLALVNGLVLDPSGTLYIVSGSGTVRKVSNGVITPVAATGGFGIARDVLGNLYIAVGNIKKISNGVITTVAGSASPGRPSPSSKRPLSLEAWPRPGLWDRWLPRELGISA